jgi:hypothetical protein
MRPNCDAGIVPVARLTVRRSRVGFGWAGISTSATFIGAAGRALKMRGWRRGCDSVDGTEFSAGATVSTGLGCGLGLNRSSAFFRALSIFSRSTRASDAHSLGKRYSSDIVKI